MGGVAEGGRGVGGRGGLAKESWIGHMDSTGKANDAMYLLPVHGGVCKRGTGNQLPLGLLMTLCTLARCFVVCLGGGGGSEGQAGSQWPGLIHQRRLQVKDTDVTGLHEVPMRAVDLLSEDFLIGHVWMLV